MTATTDAVFVLGLTARFAAALIATCTHKILLNVGTFKKFTNPDRGYKCRGLQHSFAKVMPSFTVEKIPPCQKFFPFLVSTGLG